MGRCVLVSLLLLLALQKSAFGQEPPGEGDPVAEAVHTPLPMSHIRVEDRRLRNVLMRAADTSSTLHSLIARLEDSDVVAYVQYDLRPPAGRSGHLSFVSRVAGVRYVLIRVAFIGPAASQAATIVHELRHAVEVAALTSIVDRATFEHEYARIGFRTPSRGQESASYETLAARLDGEQILRELCQSTD